MRLRTNCLATMNIGMRVAYFPPRFFLRTVDSKSARRKFALAGLLFISARLALAETARPTVIWPAHRASAGNPFEVCIVEKTGSGKYSTPRPSESELASEPFLSEVFLKFSRRDRAASCL
jgi:hypothetical protein